MYTHKHTTEEMKLTTFAQILDEVFCVSLCANAHRKGMNPSFFPPAMGQKYS